jgi:hypothetical protein
MNVPITNAHGAQRAVTILTGPASNFRTHPEDGSGHEGARRTSMCIGERGTRSLTVSLLTVPQLGHLASFRPVLH